MTASAETHRVKRQQLRKRLRGQGLPEDVIDAKVAELRDRQAAERAAAGVDNFARREAERRRQHRRRLEAQGLDPKTVERIVTARSARKLAERKRANAPAPAAQAEPTPDAPLEARLQAAARRAGVQRDDFDAHVDAFHARTRPDDRGYKPTTPDPLARGVARVSKATLRAAQRAKATTRYEHGQQERRR